MRFEALDSWRGIAALIVAIFHFHALGYLFEVPIFQHGGIAVPLFFVLSGFVIAHAYRDRITDAAGLTGFLIRRLGRIYPLHLFTLLGLVALELVKLFLVSQGVPAGEPPFEGVNSLPKLAASLALLQSIIPFDDYSWNGPSWSISTEMAAYVVFALTMLFGGKRRAFWGLVLFAAFFVALAAFELSGIQLTNPNTQGVGLLVCLFGFFTGTQTLRLFHWLADRGWRGGPIVEAVGLAIAVGLFWFDPFGGLGTCLSFALLILAFAGEGGFLSAFLTTAVPQFLGRISYSIYLVHFPIIIVLHAVLRILEAKTGASLMTPDGYIDFGPKIAMDGLVVVFLAALIVISALTYRFIEVPARNFFNDIADKAAGLVKRGARPTHL